MIPKHSNTSAKNRLSMPQQCVVQLLGQNNINQSINQIVLKFIIETATIQICNNPKILCEYSWDWYISKFVLPPNTCTQYTVDIPLFIPDLFHCSCSTCMYWNTPLELIVWGLFLSHETWSHLVLHIVKPRGFTWGRQEALHVCVFRDMIT